MKQMTKITKSNVYYTAHLCRLNRNSVGVDEYVSCLPV